MVAGFHLTVSLPMSSSTSNSPNPKGRDSDKSYHVRSTSLPSCSHPLISQLEDEIRAIKTWHYSLPEMAEQSSLVWLCDGLRKLEQLHASIDDHFQLPKAQHCLRRSAGTHRLLEDILRLVDAYGTLRVTTMELVRHGSEARVALRRRDDARLVSCARSQKKAEKELAKLMSSLRGMAKSPAVANCTTDAGEAELVGILKEVITATVSVSMSVFLGIASASSVVSTTVSRFSSSTASLFRLSRKKPDQKEVEEGKAWRQIALEKLEALVENLAMVEKNSEREFRSLVSTRVSLLNITSSW